MRFWLGVLVMLAAAVGAWFWNRPRYPTEADVRAHVVASFRPFPVRVAAVAVTFGPPGKVFCPVTYHASIETTAPLYRRVDTADYLRSRSTADWATIEAAAALLRGPDGDRLRAAVGPAPRPALTDLILVTTATPAGTFDTISGKLLGWREGGSWRFAGDTVRIATPRIAGEPPPHGALAIELADDAARFRALIADHVAYAAKVQAAAADGNRRSEI